MTLLTVAPFARAVATTGVPLRREERPETPLVPRQHLWIAIGLFASNRRGEAEKKELAAVT